MTASDGVIERWISVSAEGEASVAPDLALVSFAVTANGRDLAPVREDVLTRSSAVLAALRELGVAEGDVSAPDVGIQPEYDYRKGQRLIGYRVVRTMTVRVRDLDHLGPVLDGVVAAGANEVGGAQMTASDPSSAEHAALVAAMAAARAKAEVLATAAGVTLGRVARIEEEPAHGIGLVPKFRAMAGIAEQADASTEVVPGELTVTSRLRAWFDIER